MNLHKHARLTPRGRALLVDRVIEQGLRVEEAAHAAGVSVRTAYKWLRRFREEGLSGLQDRSSRPQSSPCVVGSAQHGQAGRGRRGKSAAQAAHRRSRACGAEQSRQSCVSQWPKSNMAPLS